jgi:putative PIG3 family NAD(P)H quinone oxidoreductase
MRAVIFETPGREAVLEVREVPPPDLANDEIRIRVAGAGVNRADLLQRRGLYPPPPGASEILGLECAGEVLELGPRVEGFAVGDRVMALLAGGGYAEEVAVPAACAIAVPDRLTDLEAAGVPEVFITAHLNLFRIGRLQPGEAVLVHGGSGGVGTAAIQLARSVGAMVAVTAGSTERCRRCLELGATLAVDYNRGDFLEELLALTDGRGADLILDCIGGSYLGRHLDLLATGGRLVIIGLQGGALAEIDLAAILRKRLTVTGSTLRARPVEDKATIIRGFLSDFGETLADGRIRPVVDRTLPFEAAAEAHRLLAAGEIFGKVILTPS